MRKVRIMILESDRNVISKVGLGDNGPRPRVWKVYSRKKAKGMRDGDVAKV
jgi:hypothetical protein